MAGHRYRPKSQAPAYRGACGRLTERRPEMPTGGRPPGVLTVSAARGAAASCGDPVTVMLAWVAAGLTGTPPPPTFRCPVSARPVDDAKSGAQGRRVEPHAPGRRDPLLFEFLSFAAGLLPVGLHSLRHGAEAYALAAGVDG